MLPLSVHCRSIIAGNEPVVDQEPKSMTTQEIHRALNDRAHRKIPHKHLQILMECFMERFGTPITDTNLESFLQYAWE